MVVVALSGLPGTGSSTAGKLLAKKLGLKYFSLGAYNKSHAEKFSGRKVSKETERSVAVWKTREGSSASFHMSSDDISKRKAKEGNIVIDAKLAIRMLKGVYDFSVWIKAPIKVRARRVAERDNSNPKEAEKILKEKLDLEVKSWKRIYGFNYLDQEREADLVIDTSNKTPEQIVEIIISKLRRVFIVHRWESSPDRDWYPHAKRELEKEGFAVNVLKMPHPKTPTQKEWVPYLSSAVGEPGRNTLLIGHSAGVMTILRYLEGLPKRKRIGGCIFVAGWVDNLGYKELSNFFTRPINWKKIRMHCRKFIAIHSNNDPFVQLYHGETFREKLGAGVVIEHKKGHMTDEEGVRVLDSVVSAVKEMRKPSFLSLKNQIQS